MYDTKLPFPMRVLDFAHCDWEIYWQIIKAFKGPGEGNRGLMRASEKGLLMDLNMYFKSF